MMNFNKCLTELTWCRSDLFKVIDYLEEALDAAEGANSSTMASISGALQRANQLQKEVINLLLEIEATATEK